jgi:hypothetical protein
MNINKIQKLNKLAKDLKNHNILVDSNQAISEAEKIYGQENNYMTRDNTGKQKNENKINEIQKNVRCNSFKIKHNKEQMIEIVSKLNQIIKEINDLKSCNKKSNIQKNINTKKDLNQPIDRNQVAPSDVSIDKYFYYGQK